MGHMLFSMYALCSTRLYTVFIDLYIFYFICFYTVERQDDARVQKRLCATQGKILQPDLAGICNKSI